MMRPLVFIPERIALSAVDRLKMTCQCVTPWIDADGAYNPEEHRHHLYGADAVIVRLFPVTGEDMDQCSRLKIISKHGVGVDNIDCRAAKEHGIPVAYTPAGNANAVAEHALTLILALARHLVPAGQALREGRFSERDRFQGIELAGKNLGVIGLGRIGSRVARIAGYGFGMTVYAYDPYLSSSADTGPAIMTDALSTLLTLADFITLHIPLTRETRHLINAERLGQVKPGCRIINTSRGAVVDESALADALRSGRLAGAALDVFEDEPLPADHFLCQTPNLLLTPHIAGVTREASEQVALQAAQAALDVLQGKTPEYTVA